MGVRELSTVAGRRFFDEVSLLLQKKVTVETTSGRSYTGVLAGFNPETMSLCLSDVKDQSGKTMPKVVLNGSIVAHVLAMERGFDLRALADRLEKVFPKMVKIYETAGIIVVMDRIRVSEQGVIEGSGPMAEHVQRVYDEFMRELKK